jgi:hypothetical protein
MLAVSRGHRDKIIVMNEIWKPVVGYEGIYEVSDAGRVKRVVPAQGQRGTGGILHSWISNTGYAMVALCKNGKAKTRSVHSEVAAAFIGPRPKGLDVNHKNGIRSDPRLENLEYLTRAENCQYSYRVLGAKNNTFSGEASGKAKLTAHQVIEIRKLHTGKYGSLTHLGRMFGVSKHTILQVVNRRTWRHI